MESKGEMAYNVYIHTFSSLSTHPRIINNQTGRQTSINSQWRQTNQQKDNLNKLYVLWCASAVCSPLLLCVVLLVNNILALKTSSALRVSFINQHVLPIGLIGTETLNLLPQALSVPLLVSGDDRTAYCSEENSQHQPRFNFYSTNELASAPGACHSALLTKGRCFTLFSQCVVKSKQPDYCHQTKF